MNSQSFCRKICLKIYFPSFFFFFNTRRDEWRNPNKSVRFFSNFSIYSCRWKNCISIVSLSEYFFIFNFPSVYVFGKQGGGGEKRRGEGRGGMLEFRITTRLFRPWIRLIFAYITTGNIYFFLFIYFFFFIYTKIR